MSEKSVLDTILARGLERMAANNKEDKGKTKLDTQVAKVQKDVDTFRNLEGGKAFPKIAKDKIRGMQVMYLFTEADNVVYLSLDGSFIQTTCDVQEVEKFNTKEIVSKYGASRCRDGLLEAARRFEAVQSDIANHGNPATVVEGVHAAAR